MSTFRQACPAGVLFLHGGGNLGDIWSHHQHFREYLLETVRDRAVVQLPQSIHFREPERARRFATLAGDHPDFTLYVRDARSLAFAAAQIDCPARLVPDSAIALGPQVRGDGDCDVLMLLRSDDERRDHGGLPSAAARVVDWLVDDADLPAGDGIAAREAQATARVARGLHLLSKGERIVTDRLHGHILASLLGIPHVVLDNDYGKIAAYMQAWPPSVPVATAATMAEAERRAEGLPAG